jgi:hypothetical protein
MAQGGNAGGNGSSGAGRGSVRVHKKNTQGMATAVGRSRMRPGGLGIYGRRLSGTPHRDAVRVRRG